jgi:hypothetical protein
MTDTLAKTLEPQGKLKGVALSIATGIEQYVYVKYNMSQ